MSGAVATILQLLGNTHGDEIQRAEEDRTEWQKQFGSLIETMSSWINAAIPDHTLCYVRKNELLLV